MKNILPNDFLDNMKFLLSDTDYSAFLNEFDKPHYKGIRVNTLKTDNNALKSILDINLTPSPFCENGFYISSDVDNIGKSALHHAGAFYVQEPSATSAVTILDVQPNDKVLDLCAAPGGKTTQIASALQGTGLLWSNEIVKNRASILLSNIERMGVTNCIISSSHPDDLCNKLINYFDKILVDAPCSGEGMFRKDNTAIEQWSNEHTKACGARQLQILESASKALKPNGILVYSTCTFSVEENENVITEFLSKHSEFELIDCNVTFGRKALNKAIRILPIDGGEGHFIAKLRKKDDNTSQVYTNLNSKNNKIKNYDDIIKSAISLYDLITTNRFLGDNFYIVKDKIYILPKNTPNLSGLYILRAGVLFGEIKKNRIEPCHAFFMCGKKSDFTNYIDLDCNDSKIKKYLMGEEIETYKDIKGYTAVCVNGITTGFAKSSNKTLKNKYPKGLRNL